MSRQSIAEVVQQSKERERRACERYLEKEPGFVTAVIPTVDGSGHFTGINIYYPGGFHWVYTGRYVRQFFEFWGSVAQQAARPKKNARKKSRP